MACPNPVAGTPGEAKHMDYPGAVLLTLNSPPQTIEKGGLVHCLSPHCHAQLSTCSFTCNPKAEAVHELGSFSLGE